MWKVLRWTQNIVKHESKRAFWRLISKKRHYLNDLVVPKESEWGHEPMASKIIIRIWDGIDNYLDKGGKSRGPMDFPLPS